MAWIKAHAHAQRTYIKPLLESGKLMLTLPNFPNSYKQRYVTAGFEPRILTRENILEFCKSPRRKIDISGHFGVSGFQTNRHIEPLLLSGELVEVDPRIGNSAWQKYICVEDGKPITIDEIIVDFCKQPRSRKEIAELLRIKVKSELCRYIDPLVKNGRLKMTKPERPTSVDQRFFVGENTAIVFTSDMIIEFCSVPRSRDDIAKRFQLQQHTAQNYAREFVRSGKLKYTVPLVPASKLQKFVVPEYEIVVCTEKTLMEFCAAPRTLYEIMEYFGHTNSKVAMSCRLLRFIKLGKLAYTIPELPKHKWQKYVAVT